MRARPPVLRSQVAGCRRLMRIVNGDAQELLKLKHTQTFLKTGVVDHLQRVEKTRRGRC
jgi:hypothetical protein